MQKEENTAREQQTFERFSYMKDASEVLLEMFKKDFKSTDAIGVILKLNGYKFDSARLLNFFNFRLRDEEIVAAIKDCLTKMK